MTFTNVATAARHLRSRVYETARGPSVSVRLSVPIDRQQQRRTAGLLMSALRPTISVHSCGRRGQRHVDSRRGRLNTDYLDATSTRLAWPTPQIKIADILQ